MCRKKTNRRNYFLSWRLALSVVPCLLLLTCCQLAFAQEPEDNQSRDLAIKEAIANLDSTNIHVAAQAALNLGYLRATEGVPAMLRVLQSSLPLRLVEHVIAKDSNSLSMWVATDVRAAIISSLASIGDRRAVPVLEKYLKKPPKNAPDHAGNVVYALYHITGKVYRYKDREGNFKLYAPSPIDEEDVRMRLRPDLKPTQGLTASLEIAGHDPSGKFWLGNHPLEINLAITNQSKKVIKLDISPANFVFSSVAGSGERTNTPATLLPLPTPVEEIVDIKPGGKLRLKWIVPSLKESPLSRGWAGYINIKCIYTNPRKNQSAAMWRGDQLISNSVERAY